LLIIFERIKILINEKINRLKEIMRINTKKKNEIDKLNFEYTKNKIEEILSDIETKNLNNTNNYTSMSSFLVNNISFNQEKSNEKLLNNVTEINNDDDIIIEKNSLNYSFNHYYTFKGQSDCQNEEYKNEMNKNENNDKEKKDFYKKVLIDKFEILHSSHLDQKISPKEIFFDVKKIIFLKKSGMNLFIMNYKILINIQLIKLIIIEKKLLIN